LNLFLREPEDDPIKVEKCRPDNILLLLYINSKIVIVYKIKFLLTNKFVQGITEITPTFGGVTARAVEGIQ